jgi:hypothetical protein
MFFCFLIRCPFVVDFFEAVTGRVMPLISVTRLRVRSIRYLLQFAWHAFASARQAQRAPGFLAGRIVREPGNIFWTLTAWKDATAMKAFRDTEAHKRAMPRLLDWCDEACVVNWEQESLVLPDWLESYERIVLGGRPSKVKHPSEAQLANRIAQPRIRGDQGTRLKPSRD